MSALTAIKFELSDHVAVITLNRPDKKNAINRAMRYELQRALVDVKNNREIWLCILTGEGDTFCSGKDLLEKIAPEDDDGSVMSNDELYYFLNGIYKPVIAALNGPCLAQGGGFALNSDIVIMSERASIGWPQVRRGISTVSGPSLCAHAIPWQQAMGYMMRGVPIPASECLRWGVANEVVAHADLLPTARRWACEIMANAPLAVSGVKEAARRGQWMSFESRMYMARDVANRVLLSEDSKEGIAAFKAKRPPVWRAR
jgi:enoyl-CoA hydratase/carnithine racemase